MAPSSYLLILQINQDYIDPHLPTPTKLPEVEVIKTSVANKYDSYYNVLYFGSRYKYLYSVSHQALHFT